MKSNELEVLKQSKDRLDEISDKLSEYRDLELNIQKEYEDKTNNYNEINIYMEGLEVLNKKMQKKLNFNFHFINLLLFISFFLLPTVKTSIVVCLIMMFNIKAYNFSIQRMVDNLLEKNNERDKLEVEKNEVSEKLENIKASIKSIMNEYVTINDVLDTLIIESEKELEKEISNDELIKVTKSKKKDKEKKNKEKSKKLKLDTTINE